MPRPERLTIAGRPATLAPLGDAALLLSFGSSVDSELNRFILNLTRSLLEADLDGVLDLVPAYTSLLIVYDPLVTSCRALQQALTELPEIDDAADLPVLHHEVPVVYGGEAGPDLDALATAHNLEPDEVIGLHTGRDYRVYFLGFMPGFAYMGVVAPQIATPRFASPRSRVPAGSVGIAGDQTGIYPFASPGGWNIIGRTAVQLWDPLREDPALLAPGDTVRFVRAAVVIEAPSNADALLPPAPARPVLTVRRASGLSSVQDLGRPGFGRYGVPIGGALDPVGLSAANTLLGNPPGAAAIELIGGSLELDVARTTVIAVSGTGSMCLVDGQPMVSGMSWLVRAGWRVRLESRTGVSYLAVAGGIEVLPVLGSASTLLQAGFGGFQGRPLRQGDVLGSGATEIPPSAMAGRTMRGANRLAGTREETTVSVIPYTGPNSAGREALRRFLDADWKVSARSNRMGMRFEQVGGEGLPETRGELLSFGVVRGVIQLPPGGEPIVLGPDHGTTGGYPVLGVVPQWEWGKLAQLGTGDRIRFEASGTQ